MGSELPVKLPVARDGVFPRGYFVVGATFLLSVLLYVDRACISTAKDAVTGELGLSKDEWSWVLASFAFGYAVFQTPSGALADRLGGRVVLTGMVTLWSVFTGLTAMAWNFATLLAVRFLFGAGEAGAFPGMARVVYSWIPVNERGLVKGINFSGSRIGAALAMPLVAALIANAGWKKSFLIIMAAGFIWAALWWRCFRDEPAAHGGIKPQEREYILKNRQDGGIRITPEPLRVSALFTSPNLWLMMGQYFASNFTFFFSLTWLYPYVKARYQLTAVDAGFCTMLPLLAGAAGNILSGWMVDALYRGGRSPLSRRLPAIAGFLLAALGMVMSVHQQSAAGAVAWLSIAIFGADMTLSPSWSFCIDIGGRHAGAVSGTMNMAGNLGSAVTALAFAYLPESSKGNEAFFYTAAGLSGCGVLCWLAANPEKRIE